MKKTFFLTTLILLAGLANLHATIYYVKSAGAGDLSGSSWANASDDLQVMINNAQAGGDTVFVAEGSYYPTKESNHLAGTISPYNRNNAFVLKKDVKIYGSFPANANDNEHNDIDCRFPNPNSWTLSTYLIGNLRQNEDWDSFAYHVVISVGDVGSALLNGIVIANGNANGSTDDEIMVNGYEISNAMGGGMCNVFSSPTLSRVIIYHNMAKYGGGMFNSTSFPTISSSTISNNTVDYVGGGIYNFRSSPTLANVYIQENRAGTDGGGMINRYASNPHITNTTIRENRADKGGGIYNQNQSAPIIKSTTIMNNTAGYGGGIYNYSSGNAFCQNVVIYKNTATTGGGGGVVNHDSNPTFLNVVIAENTGKLGGGGMTNTVSSPTLVNVTVGRNTSGTKDTYGGGIRNSNSSRPRIYNSIVWGNIGYPQVYNELNSHVSCYHSLVETETTGDSNNINGSIDPLFVGDIGYDFDYYLMENSPCIDKGNNAYYTENGGNLETDVDLKGDPRLSGASIDMGAYEAMEQTGILSPELKTNTDIIALEGKIQFKGLQGQQISIYTPDGRLYLNHQISNDLETIPLPEGLYIILAGGKSQKVLVK